MARPIRPRSLPFRPTASSMPTAAGSDHIRCTLAAADGTRIKAIAFRALGTDLGELLLTERQHPLHFAGRLTVDEWGGRAFRRSKSRM